MTLQPGIPTDNEIDAMQRLSLRPTAALILSLTLLLGCSDHLKQAKAPVAHASTTQGLAVLDADIKARVDQGRYPGAVFIIARGEQILHAGAVGVSDIDDRSPMQLDSVFRIMSMTKPVTTVAAMMLVEQGQLSLDEPVKTYLPEFANFDRAGATPLTVRHLLTHTGGFSMLALLPKEKTTLADRIHELAEDGPDNDAGEKWRYSGVDGFDVVARVVEVLSKQPFEQFLEQHLFGPLGMKDTSYVLNAEQQRRLVGLYKARGGSIVKDKPFMVPADFLYPSGGGGLYSTASDYIRFAQMLAGGGALGPVRILKPETVKQISTEQLPTGYPGLPKHYAWALGMRLVSEESSSLSPLPIGSYGWSGHFGTHFWVEPQHHLSAVFMINLTNAGGAGSVDAFDFERLVVDACRTDARCAGDLPAGGFAPESATSPETAPQ